MGQVDFFSKLISEDYFVQVTVDSTSAGIFLAKNDFYVYRELELKVFTSFILALTLMDMYSNFDLEKQRMSEYNEQKKMEIVKCRRN